MSITYELREWVRDGKGSLLAIADRIDAEHEAKVSYWQDASYKDGYDEGFASADDWLGQHEDAMAEHGWVRLPVDADGVPIRVGDYVEETDARLIGRAHGEVVRIVFNRLTTDVRIDTGLSYADRSPQSVRHITKKPTVEDVLDEFANAVLGCDNTEESVQRVIAEYAAKLRLAGDGK